MLTIPSYFFKNFDYVFKKSITLLLYYFFIFLRLPANYLLLFYFMKMPEDSRYFKKIRPALRQIPKIIISFTVQML